MVDSMLHCIFHSTIWSIGYCQEVEEWSVMEEFGSAYR